MKKLFALLMVFSLAAIGCEEKKSSPSKPADTKTTPKPDPTTPKPDPTTPKPDPTTKKEETTKKADTTKKEDKPKDGGPDLKKGDGK